MSVVSVLRGAPLHHWPHSQGVLLKGLAVVTCCSTGLLAFSSGHQATVGWRQMHHLREACMPY